MSFFRICSTPIKLWIFLNIVRLSDCIQQYSAFGFLLPYVTRLPKADVQRSIFLQLSSSTNLQYSSLTEVDWACIAQKRRDELLTETSNEYDATANFTTTTTNNIDSKITHPQKLPFFAGIQFLSASAKGKAHQFLNNLRKQHGDAFIIWNHYVTITDASAIQDVLEVYNLPKPDNLLRGYHFMFPGNGGILAAPWEE